MSASPAAKLHVIGKPFSDICMLLTSVHSGTRICKGQALAQDLVTTIKPLQCVLDANM